MSYQLYSGLTAAQVLGQIGQPVMYISSSGTDILTGQQIFSGTPAEILSSLNFQAFVISPSGNTLP